MQTLLFLCTGNTCRSPLAEAIARHWVDRGAGDLDPATTFVASAGLFAAEGSPVSDATLRTLSNLGIEHQGSSKQVTAEMIQNASAVYCMTADHRQSALAMAGPDSSLADKVQLLDPEGDIADPIGMSQDVYDQLGRQMMSLMPARLAQFAEASGRSVS